FGLLLRDTRRHWNLSAANNVITGDAARALRNDLLGHWASGLMSHNPIGEPFGGAHEEMGAAHCGIHEIQPENCKGEGIITAALLGPSGQGALDFLGPLDFVEQRRKRFADEKLNDPIGRIKDSVAMVFA